MKIIFLLFFLFFLSLTSFSQILNIEQNRIHEDSSDLAGWHAEAKFSFESTEDNEDNIIDANASLNLKYVQKKNVYMFLGNYNLMKLDNKDLMNNTYLHHRYNRKLNNRFIWEAFTQVQSNKHRGYELRWLLGTGPRFRIHSTKKFALNSGVLYMYEYEVENNREAYLHEHRISSYLSFELELAEKLSLIHTSYYQPKINYFKDYRIQTQTNLKFKFTKKISFLLTYNLLYDEYPPKNVKHSNHYYLTELLIDL